jgi:hypothetical protein
VSGTTQKLTLQSNPPGATVTVDGNVLGTTPLVAAIKRRARQAVLFSKEGFEALSLELNSDTNGWFWGNILVGGVFGSTTDSATGSVHEYAPSEYLVTLQPQGTSRVEASSALSQIQRAKEFIVVNYEDIRTDLQRGRGSFLSSLLRVLNIPETEQERAINKIRILEEAYPNVPQFASNVTGTYLGEETNSPAGDIAPVAPMALTPAKTIHDDSVKRTYYFVGLDYFGKGDLDDNAGPIERDASAFVNFVGGIPESSVKSQGGAGFRVGFLKAMTTNFRLGASVGYIPTLKTTVDVHDGTFPPGDLITKIDSSYVRALIDAAKYIPINKSYAIKLGAGFGVGQGTTKQTYNGSGFYDGISSEFSHKSTGFTWEVSPAMVLTLDGNEFELGLRYAQFPKIKETDQTYEVKYSGLGAYASFIF